MPYSVCKHSILWTSPLNLPLFPLLANKWVTPCQVVFQTDSLLFIDKFLKSYLYKLFLESKFQKRRSKKVFPNLNDVIPHNNGLLLFEIVPSLVSDLNEVSLLFVLFLNVFLDNIKILPIVFAKNRSLKALLLKLVHSVFARELGVCLDVVDCLELTRGLHVRLCYIELLHCFRANLGSRWEGHRIYHFFNQNLGVVGWCGSLRGHFYWHFWRV